MIAMKFTPLTHTAGFALVTLALSVSAGVSSAFASHASSPGGGEGHASVNVAELAEAFLLDVENDVSYECTCDGEKGGKKAADCSTHSSPRGQLVKMLSVSPEAAVALQPVALAAMRGKSAQKKSEAMIGLLLDSWTPGACAVAEAMHEAEPKRFGAAQLHGFCDRGAKGLLKPLATLVAKGEGDVMAAAYVASKGNKSGKSALVRAIKVKQVNVENALDVLVAGHALGQLGHKSAAADARLRVHDAVLAALDARDLDAARSMAIASRMQNSAAQSSTVALSGLRDRCKSKLEASLKKGKLATADAVFHFIQKQDNVL